MPANLPSRCILNLPQSVFSDTSYAQIIPHIQPKSKMFTSRCLSARFFCKLAMIERLKDVGFASIEPLLDLATTKVTKLQHSY